MTSLLRRVRDPGPRGVKHVVRQGESVDSLACEYGHAGDTIWKHRENRELVARRGDFRALAPGDEVYIPPRKLRRIDGLATDRRHVFRRKDVPSLLRFRPLLIGGEGHAERFEVHARGERIAEGPINRFGDVECMVEPTERAVTVTVFFAAFSREYHVVLRALDPVTEVSGVQQRLAALGFYGGAVDGVAGPETERALGRFRMHIGLHEGSGADDRVLDALHRLFGG